MGHLVPVGFVEVGKGPPGEYRKKIKMSRHLNWDSRKPHLGDSTKEKNQTKGSNLGEEGSGPKNGSRMPAQAD